MGKEPGCLQESFHGGQDMGRKKEGRGDNEEKGKHETRRKEKQTGRGQTEGGRDGGNKGLMEMSQRETETPHPPPVLPRFCGCDFSPPAARAGRR